MQRVSRIAKVLRVLRRTFHQRTGKRRLDLNQIEHRIICSFYRKIAADLGLNAYDIGRVHCIAGHGKSFRIWGCTTEFDTYPLYGITEDKVLVKKLFRDRGIPVPEGRAFQWNDRSAGIEYALSLGRPCVAKPASDTSSGKGVTADMTTRREIAHAFRFAGLFAPQVLVEEFVPGDNYRFLIYKGKCLSVLRRELPAVIGNGSSTVRDLVKDENRNRIQHSDWRDGDPLWMPLPINSGALRHLKRQGIEWRSVPRLGEQVYLAGESSYGFGCTYTEVLGKTHAGQISAAEDAARLVGMTVAGVDIVSPDIEAAAFNILEINISPGLEAHYVIRNPEDLTDPIRTILTDFFEIDGTGLVG
jgi:cyanophycin synthetase